MSDFRRRIMMSLRGEAPEPVIPLPAGYTNYKWCTGNAYASGAYIDTGIAAVDSGVRIEAVVQTTDALFDMSELFGESGTWHGMIRVNGSYQFEFFYPADGIYVDNSTFATVKNKRLTIIADDNGISVNGSTSTRTSDRNNPRGNFLFLKGVFNRTWFLPVLSFKIYINDALVRHFVPCTDPNDEPGFYDVVSEAFFGNDGSGSLVVGNS